MGHLRSKSVYYVECNYISKDRELCDWTSEEHSDATYAWRAYRHHKRREHGKLCNRCKFKEDEDSCMKQGCTKGRS